MKTPPDNDCIENNPVLISPEVITERIFRDLEKIPLEVYTPISLTEEVLLVIHVDKLI
jgi:hypothetical protein